MFPAWGKLPPIFCYFLILESIILDVFSLLETTNPVFIMKYAAIGLMSAVFLCVY